MMEVWDFCRHANQYLGIVAAIGVSYRLTSMMLDRGHWLNQRAAHLLAWFTYVALGLIVSSFAAGYYNGGLTPASWTSGARTLLHLSAIGLTAWWPHPKRFLPIEGRES